MQSWPMVRPVYADIRDFLTNYIGKKFNNKASTGPRSAARFEPEVRHKINNSRKYLVVRPLAIDKILASCNN